MLYTKYSSWVQRPNPEDRQIYFPETNHKTENLISRRPFTPENGKYCVFKLQTDIDIIGPIIK